MMLLYIHTFIIISGRRSVKFKKPFPEFDAYNMCWDCAKKYGGEFKGGCVTCTMGTCEYCKEPDKTLIPWVDFKWKNLPGIDTWWD